MSLRIGVNWHNKARGGAERSADEKTYQIQFLKQLNASAIVVMDNFDFAQMLYNALPHTIVIYRQSNPAEGHLWRSGLPPEQYVINQAGITKSGMPLYVMNEPNARDDVSKDDFRDRVNWAVRVMDQLAVKGCSAVIENLGAGHPGFSWFTDNDKWAIYKPLFDAFKRYPLMYWGLHPYWDRDGLRPDKGQSARHRDIEKYLGERGYAMPPVIFTEVGRDNYAGSKTNGWRSTGVTEEVYAAEIVTARNTLWTEPYIRGACVYCYGSSTMQWWPFDMENAKILHSSLIAANETQQLPPPDPVPVPVPADLVALREVRAHVNAVANRTRKVSLELASISDDLLKDVQLLDALIQARETSK